MRAGLSGGALIQIASPNMQALLKYDVLSVCGPGIAALVDIKLHVNDASSGRKPFSFPNRPCRVNPGADLMANVADIQHILEDLIPLRYAESWDNVGLLVGDPAREVRKLLVTVDLTPSVGDEATRLGCDMIVAYHPPLFKPAAKLGPGDPIWHALSRGISVWSPHTAFDAVRGGTNDHVAKLLGLSLERPLRPFATEPALGQGRVGRFESPAQDLLAGIKQALELDHMLVAGEIPTGSTTLAIAAGSGASMLDDARREGAAVMLVGEASHHDALRAQRSGITLIATLHSRIERPAVRALAAQLESALPVPVYMSQADAEPYRFV